MEIDNTLVLIYNFVMEPEEPFEDLNFLFVYSIH